MSANGKVPEVISSLEVYTQAEFRRRCGFGDHSWREIRQRLLVIEIGRKRFIRGATWLALLEELEEEQQQGKLDGRNV